MPRAGAHPRLTRTILDDLFHYLDDRLEEEWCDQTHRYTKDFLTERGMDVGTTLRWLERSGGYCDCEVLMNVPHRGWWNLPD